MRKDGPITSNGWFWCKDQKPSIFRGCVTLGEADLHVERGRTLQRAPLRSGDHCPLCALVSAIQTQLSRSRRDDGRTRALAGAHDDHALDPTLCPGIRKALEPLRP